MITSTTVLWTCLPNGVVTTSTGAVASPLTLKVSLFVTPRISATAATDTINGTVFQNWPAQVRAITAAGGWNVDFSTTEYPAMSVTLAEDYLGASYLNVDAATLWAAIFPATTPVVAPNPVAPDFTIHSYGASTIANAFREAHRHVVASQSATGKIKTTGGDPYTTLLNEQAKARYALPRVAKALKRVSRGSTHRALAEAYTAEMGSLGLGYELVRHALFYDRGGHRANARGAAVNGHVHAETVGVSPIDGTTNPNDFNTLIAHLGGQPELLRKLGLVIDLLVVPPTSVSSALLSTATQFNVALNLPKTWTATANTYAAQPFTACDITTSSFAATQYPTTQGLVTMTSGMLPLNTSQFSVMTEDTEGSPVKLEMASNGSATTAAASDTAAPLPALRTAGFTITQNTRELNLENTFNFQQQLSTAYFTGPTGNQGAAQLRAQDLVRGYRVDVAVLPNGTTMPTAASFQSLCLRDSRVYFPTLGSSLLLSDEGYIKATAATSPLNASDELDVHEAIFGWDGWSLAAPRPGRAITATADTDPKVQDEVPNQPINTPAGLYPSVEITVRPRAAKLPRLRFGNWYSFRARMTDLAGNDMSVPNAVVCSTAKQYLRYEPVSNPVLVLKSALTEGEHVERLVIRSNPYGTTPMNAAVYAASYAATSPPAVPMNPYAATNVRWLAPPKGAWAASEAHGRFDTYFNEMSAAMKADMPVAGVGYVDPTFVAAKNALYALSQKESGSFSTPAVWDTSANTIRTNPVTTVTPASAQNLPAPTTRGNPLSPGQYTVLAPTAALPVVYIPYLPDPNAAGVSLQQVTVNSAGATSYGSPMVRTWAPRPGCAWPELDLPQLVLQEGTGATFTITGLDPAPASNAPIVVSLPAGQQLVLQSSSTLVDPTKMASSDLGTASGQIPTYAPGRPITLVHAVQQPVPPGPPTLTAAVRAPGQTNVALRGSIVADGATSSHLDLIATWTEMVDTELTTGVQVAPNGSGMRDVQKTGRVQTWTMGTTDAAITIPATPALHHEFGDTKTRNVTYQAVATSRFREYFPAGLQTNSANFTNSNLENTTVAANVPPPIRIPSTARPAPPNVLYVVPTYQWSSSGPTGSTTNTRLGGGLRVFVDRPWFTTGDTEYLGVLVAGSTTSATLNDYVSQWGVDPIRFPQGASAAPFSGSLVQGYSGVVAASIPLAEGVGSVNVYPFAPTAFDATRNLWYFDIELANELLEAPFVRLALARFQPNSIFNATTDLRLSTVVRADMVKLTPDRTAAYVTNTNNTVNVTVKGLVFANESWAPGQTNYSSGRVVVAQVLEATVANPGEFDWVPVGSQLVLNSAQSGGNASTLLTFTGTVPVPAGLKAGAKHQLLLTELELFDTDAEAKFPGSQAVTNYPTGQFRPYETTGSVGIIIINPNSTSRVVFSDVMPLPY